MLGPIIVVPILPHWRKSLKVLSRICPCLGLSVSGLCLFRDMSVSGICSCLGCVRVWDMSCLWFVLSRICLSRFGPVCLVLFRYVCLGLVLAPFWPVFFEHYLDHLSIISYHVVYDLILMFSNIFKHKFSKPSRSCWKLKAIPLLVYLNKLHCNLSIRCSNQSNSVYVRIYPT